MSKPITLKMHEGPGLQAARQGAAFQVLEGAGVVQLGGETRFDYLQRQTSNDMRRVQAGRALPNVLTAPTGRIIEIFRVLEAGDAYQLLTPPGRGAALVEYLQQRIFFNDNIVVNDASAHWAQVVLCGPESTALFAATTGLAEAPAPDEVRAGAFDGKPIQVIGADAGILLLLPIQALNALEAALEDQGAAALDATEAEILRVEDGRPGWGYEIKPDYTPYEVGLGDWVSGDKGCYTGQEVLARQVTYDKVTRGLVRLHLEQPVQAGAGVQAGGKAAGELTSAVVSPRLGPIGLAVLRRAALEAGDALTVLDRGQAVAVRAMAA